MYFTLPLVFRRSPTDFDRTQPIPTDSAGQSVGRPTESVGIDQSPLLVQPQSGPSPVKSSWSRKGSDWPVHRTSDGLRGRKQPECVKCQVRRMSNGCPMDFQWTFNGLSMDLINYRLCTHIISIYIHVRLSMDLIKLINYRLHTHIIAIYLFIQLDHCHYHHHYFFSFHFQGPCTQIFFFGLATNSARISQNI